MTNSDSQRTTHPSEPDTGLDAYRLPFPHVLRIEPASKCNLACSHCPTGTVDMIRSIMKPDVMERAMSQLEKYKELVRVVVLYHGGEPFLNKRFFEMLRRVKAAGIGHVKIDTNAMLMTDKIIEGVVRDGLDLIVFSTDGDSPAMNDFIRRNSKYETIVRNIKKLLDHKRKVGAKSPAVKIANARFIDPSTYRGGLPEPSPHLLEEFKDYLDEVDIVSHWIIRWPHLPVEEEWYETVFDPYDTRGDQSYCDHVHHTMTVRWNGDVVACCYDLTSELLLGNIMQDDLVDIWNGERYLQLRQSLATKKYVPTCENCNVVRQNVLLYPRPEVLARLKS
jgi:radical SAM protein with 4Fe4S-binding SPASM domain